MRFNLEWRVYSLEFDKAGARIGSFFEDLGYNISRINPLRNKQGYSRRGFHGTIATLESALKHAIKSDERVLAVYGSGTFHHITYGLCRIADKLSKNYCYIHIDHHCDAWDYFVNLPLNKHKLYCGGFVKHIFYHTNVSCHTNNVIFIGTGKKISLSKHSMFHGKLAEGITEFSIARNGFKKLKQLLDTAAKDAYVTIDLDVMHPDEAITSYDRGRLRKDALLEIISLIKSKKRLIGADVLGYDSDAESFRAYANNKREMRKKTLELYKDIVDSFLAV